jgi:uncharacterized phage protein gp47/JayE
MVGLNALMMMMMMMMMMITILEQHSRKARYQGTADNSHIGHSTHTAESANVEAQTTLILKTALYAPLTVRAE